VDASSIPPKWELARAWLDKAAGDLDVARLILRASRPRLDVCCFLCQQTIEKGLKAFLIYHEQKPPRTHDLRELLQLCSAINPSLSALATSCTPLTAFAVDARYPDSFLVFTPEGATRAFAAAEQALTAVVGLLPPEVHP
jgi:HEPN domain-containing protein